MAKKRNVTIDKQTKIAYDYEEKGGGFAIAPPKWANPFFVRDLTRADQILANLYRIRVIQKLGHP